MTTITSLPSFDATANALEYLDALGSAAQTHGLLCALFAANAQMHKQAWVNSMMTKGLEKGDLTAKDAQKTLEQLFVASRAQFDSDSFEVDLLLPCDEVEIEHRIEAIAEWCQGFVSGLKLAGINVTNNDNQQMQEALSDLIAISCLSYDDESTGEPVAESQFQELVEFVRVAVMLINAEKQQLDQQEAKKDGSVSH